MSKIYIIVGLVLLLAFIGFIYFYSSDQKKDGDLDYKDIKKAIKNKKLPDLPCKEVAYILLRQIYNQTGHITNEDINTVYKTYKKMDKKKKDDTSNSDGDSSSEESGHGNDSKSSTD